MTMEIIDLKKAIAKKVDLHGVGPEEVVKAFSGDTPTPTTALLAGVKCWGFYHPHWGVGSLLCGGGPSSSPEWKCLEAERPPCKHRTS